MRGRKRKPTHLHIVQGTAQKCRLNKNEPKPESAAPGCPPHLKGEAKKEWSRAVKELVASGLMTRLDRAALAGYCQAWERWIEAEEALRKTGVIVKAPSGYAIQSPYLAIANKAMDQMRAFLVEFGMSPASRARAHSTTANEGSNPFDEI